MKCLRRFLQSVVRQRMKEMSSGGKDCLSVTDFHKSLPSSAALKLSAAFDELISISAQSSFLAMLGGEDLELEEVFSSKELYREAQATWAECIPLMYATGPARIDVLQSLVKACSASRLSGPVPTFRSIDSMSSFPVHETEPDLHRLQVLCRRLRVSDLLDGFVSKPLPYYEDDEQDLSLRSNKSEGMGDLDDPHLASSVVAMLGSSLPSLLGARAEAQRLYLALCHRCQTRSLLFDGLYAITETGSEKAPASSIASKSVPGNTLRVNMIPSSSLQFDSTKCSDSIALISAFNESPSGGSGASVHQRASKVWGTVLSTHHYSPKTGVHRWAVRLDKCERGHVFIGVATAQASMRTYVGGDKFGWGMIGTQALWHDRRKVCTV